MIDQRSTSSDLPIANGQEHSRISVIIPHYNDLARLDLCLTALAAQTVGEAFEIVVADNMSPQGESAVAKAIAGRARLVHVAERGAGPNRNGAVAVAQGDILAFTDSDCVPRPQWLEEGVAALDRYDVVGGRVVILVDDEEQMTPSEAFEAVFAFDFEDYILNKRFTGSGNMFVRKSVFEMVGGFRNKVAEDVEWSHRALSKGYTLGYAPEAVVAHPARRDWAELHRKFKRTSSEMYLLAASKQGGKLRWLARTWAMPLSAVAHTPKVLRSKALPNMRARLGALAILYCSRLWRFYEGNRLLLRKEG